MQHEWHIHKAQASEDAHAPPIQSADITPLTEDLSKARSRDAVFMHWLWCCSLSRSNGCDVVHAGRSLRQGKSCQTLLAPCVIGMPASSCPNCMLSINTSAQLTCATTLPRKLMIADVMALVKICRVQGTRQTISK